MLNSKRPPHHPTLNTNLFCWTLHDIMNFGRKSMLCLWRGECWSQYKISMEQESLCVLATILRFKLKGFMPARSAKMLLTTVCENDKPQAKCTKRDSREKSTMEPVWWTDSANSNEEDDSGNEVELIAEMNQLYPSSAEVAQFCK